MLLQVEGTTISSQKEIASHPLSARNGSPAAVKSESRIQNLLFYYVGAEMSNWADVSFTL
jgi:hypothetical protein